MGKMAARVGDMHVCTRVDPVNKAHVGGPILPPGGGTVLIGGKPAARIGDKAVCIGSTDTISEGSSSVFIGGKGVARVGDGTAHGGKIVAGYESILFGN